MAAAWQLTALATAVGRPHAIEPESIYSTTKALGLATCAVQLVSVRPAQTKIADTPSLLQMARAAVQ